MSPSRKRDRSNPTKRKCKGHKTNGQPCPNWAIRGGTVCSAHGGRAPQVKRKAAERLADLIDPDRVLREAARLAYSDITEIFTADGTLRPIGEWPAPLRAAVGALEFDEDGSVRKVKLWDKSRNVELLARHLGLLKDKLELTGDAEVLAALRAGRQRAAQRRAEATG